MSATARLITGKDAVLLPGAAQLAQQQPDAADHP